MIQPITSTATVTIMRFQAVNLEEALYPESPGPFLSFDMVVFFALAVCVYLGVERLIIKCSK